jgi:hypothetical protein
MLFLKQCFIIALIVALGCKKSVYYPTTLEGRWTLNKTYGGGFAQPIDPPPFQIILEFNDSAYTWKKTSISESGTYHLGAFTGTYPSPGSLVHQLTLYSTDTINILLIQLTT